MKRYVVVYLDNYGNEKVVSYDDGVDHENVLSDLEYLGIRIVGHFSYNI